MITYFNTFTNQYALVINFFAHLMIFIGSFYVAMYNTKLPHWHVTPLWYAGLCSLFVTVTIICQWTIGPEFPLSYWNAGIMGETLLNIAIAAIALIMLIRTAKLKIKYKNKQHKE